MNKRRKTGKVIGWLLLMIAVAIGTAMLIIEHVATKPENFANHIQRSILKTENDIQTLIESNPELGQYEKTTWVFSSTTTTPYSSGTTTPSAPASSVGEHH